MLAQDIIRRKRDGLALAPAEVDAFVSGLVDASWSDAQTAALAMAICLKGMSNDETVALTRAMTRSGDILSWAAAALDGPVLDKHSTGGVGDKVSLLLAPIVAACGGFVPMISGRGLGHTGGTLDKLESVPGYRTTPDLDQLRAALREAGCVIVGQSARIAPADGRLYAIRDVTATIESVPLITASILSKKLAAGLQALVMDVKVGNGAFSADLPQARELAESIVRVAAGAGLPTTAWITDMDQVLGRSCGNALEVREAIDYLSGAEREPRLHELTRRLSADLLLAGGLASGLDPALARVDAVLADGSALDRLDRMLRALGGPKDIVRNADAHLPSAPVQRLFLAPRSGWVAAMQTRQIGMLVVELGGGRRRADSAIDHAVGLDGLLSIGRHVEAGEPVACVHAADSGSAERACVRLQSLIRIDDTSPAPCPVLVERVGAALAP